MGKPLRGGVQIALAVGFALMLTLAFAVLVRYDEPGFRDDRWALIGIAGATAGLVVVGLSIRWERQHASVLAVQAGRQMDAFQRYHLEVRAGRRKRDRNGLMAAAHGAQRTVDALRASGELALAGTLADAISGALAEPWENNNGPHGGGV